VLFERSRFLVGLDPGVGNRGNVAFECGAVDQQVLCIAAVNGQRRPGGGGSFECVDGFCEVSDLAASLRPELGPFLCVLEATSAALQGLV